VQSMMARQLGLDAPPEPQDITDALAAAFCHCQRRWSLVPEGRCKPKRSVPRKARQPGAPSHGEESTWKALLGSSRARVLATGRFRRREARGEERNRGPDEGG
jgi:hypothetical protein